VTTARRVLIVDDGIATGFTMAAATELVRSMGSAEIVVAAPVTSAYGFKTIASRVTDVIYLHYSHDTSFSVAAHYKSFPDIPLNDAVAVLKRSFAPPGDSLAT
jgi:putative phosphoribosyl transferase